MIKPCMNLSTGDAALDFVDRARAGIDARAEGIDHDAMAMVLLLHRVTNTVVYDLESGVHRPAGWTWAAFRLLFTLWLGGPTESSRAAELSGMSRQAVSALTKTLVADGLVERAPGTTDARLAVLSLTPDGERRLATAYGTHNERESRWAAALDDDERRTLIELLSKLASAARQPWVNHRF